MKNICKKLKVNKKNMILFAGLIGCIGGLIIGSNIYKSNKSCYSAPSSEDEEVLENDETLESEESAENEEDKSTNEEQNKNEEVKSEEAAQNNAETVQNSTETPKQQPVQQQQQPAQQVPQQNQSFVANLKVSHQTSQLIVVSGNGGSSATVSMHTKVNGLWKQQFSVDGHVGYNGMTGNKREGDGKTPIGVYGFGQAFGINGNPGTSLSYTQVNGNHYWVDDVNSSHYNKFVNVANVAKDWNSAEHIVDHTQAYAYAINIEYNSACQKGKGSAIFLHCSTGGGTAGCVSVPRGTMVNILNNIQPGCLIVIAPSSSIKNY
ncbi:MAG: hypothetical protein E7213_02670 [Clostridium sp.]|jgi:L,D-peptidoglycan transpeptidase YkuD (ErfK/YbiS/YcfS/YnhG family)|nr:hypothetical protein [Clostridium sp.]